MRFPQATMLITLSFGLAAAIGLAPGSAQFSALAGAASFWLVVALAVAGSVLSALCIAEPVSEPKREPYTFMGQWFIWMATPLLWSTVAASMAYSWLKPFDLLLAAGAVGVCRWGSQAVCGLQMEERRESARASRALSGQAATTFVSATLLARLMVI